MSLRNNCLYSGA